MIRRVAVPSVVSGRARIGAVMAAGLVLVASLSVAVSLPLSSTAERSRPIGGMDAIRGQETDLVSVIVREADPGTRDAESLVHRLGGRVGRDLSIVGAFAAEVPASSVSALQSSPDVSGLFANAAVRMKTVNMHRFDRWAPNAVWREAIRLPAALERYDGSGVTVALLDTGLRNVQDLGDRVLARVDLTPDLDGYDRFGHGTHMAGIIAGDGSASGGKWAGVAPGANLVSVKVASGDGATDISAVIAGLEWVLLHRDEYDIRVVSLAFGSMSDQSYALDPLDFAVERLWRSGILVVVAAGNSGPDAGTVTKPGDDPYVLTVGAANTMQTVKRSDDIVTNFSSRGPTVDGFEKPDVVAPGVTIVSNRAVDSAVDVIHPDARIDDYYIKGSGTSQAAAMVSGVAALMYEAAEANDVELTPDMAKAVLMRTAYRKITRYAGSGSGLVNAARAVSRIEGAAEVDDDGGAWIEPANQDLVPSTGAGSLEESRAYHVWADITGDGRPEQVIGEYDVLGNEWDSSSDYYSRAWRRLVAVWSRWLFGQWDGDEWGGMAWNEEGWHTKNWGSAAWQTKNWGSASWG